MGITKHKPVKCALISAYESSLLYPKDLIGYNEESKSFDSEEDENEIYFVYKDSLYSLSDFPIWDTPWTPKCPDWAKGSNACMGTSYFACLLLRLVDNNEAVEIQYCHW